MERVIKEPSSCILPKIAIQNVPGFRLPLWSWNQVLYFTPDSDAYKFTAAIKTIYGQCFSLNTDRELQKVLDNRGMLETNRKKKSFFKLPPGTSNWGSLDKFEKQQKICCQYCVTRTYFHELFSSERKRTNPSTLQIHEISQNAMSLQGSKLPGESNDCLWFFS